MQATQNDIRSFYGHGKLLISGEYLVLRGAQALAIPVRYGQSLHITEKPGAPCLNWVSHIPGKVWLSAKFNLPDLEIISSSNARLALQLQKILIAAKDLNPDYISLSHTINAVSEVEFNPSWGLGSSSTLIANIARWAGVDPFELNRLTFGGSGYDIAAALSDKPIIYQLDNGKPTYEPVDFNLPFTDRIWLVYQNKKENSREAVSKFSEIPVPSEAIHTISEITLKLCTTRSFEEFLNLLEEHENIISDVLNQPTVKQKLFPDFKGSIKSLGAWGGDFFLVASHQQEAFITGYFLNRGFNTLFRYNALKA